MKHYADKNRKETSFEVDDWAFLKLRPNRQTSLVQSKNQKLAPSSYGPFKIMQKVGAVAYKLQLPVTSRVHTVFDVSQLKEIGDCQATTDLPADWE